MGVICFWVHRQWLLILSLIWFLILLRVFISTIWIDRVMFFYAAWQITTNRMAYTNTNYHTVPVGQKSRHDSGSHLAKTIWGWGPLPSFLVPDRIEFLIAIGPSPQLLEVTHCSLPHGPSHMAVCFFKAKWRPSPTKSLNFLISSVLDPESQGSCD